MSEDSSLPAIKRASVLVRGPGGNGSGYVIAPQRIGTALHVVKSWQPGRRYQVLVGVGDERRPCSAWLLATDEEADAALLAFDEAIDAPHLEAAETPPRRGEEWQSYGYPTRASAARAELAPGLPFSGRIQDPDHVEGLLVESDQIAAGNAASIRGLSGSPVVVAGRLVGHLTRHVGDADDPGRPAYGYAIACPIAAMRKLLEADAAATASDASPRDALVRRSFRDADALYVLVVSSPGAPVAGSLDLADQVQIAWEHDRPRIEAAVNRYRRGLRLPPLPAAAINHGLVAVTLDVARAMESKDALRAAVQAICRCEAAVFDLTDQDSGVLFLLGVRSVARRGVTLTSIGGGYTIGAALSIPFNLQLLNLSAHSTRQVKLGDGQRPHELISGKLVDGFNELTDLPHYLDLPAYESVRQLGITSAAYQPIPYTEKVLVLCPFDEKYSELNWDLHIGLSLPGKLKEYARSQTPPKEPNVRVERLLESRTPRLIAQSLYEAIRLTDLCLIDWTRLRANVVFEAGVRLATNALGAVHIMEGDASGAPPHVQNLLAMLQPIFYRCASGEVPYAKMISRFDTSVRDYNEGRRNWLFDAVGQAIDPAFQSIALPLSDELIRSANLLSSDDAESVGVSPVLFSEVNKELASAVEHAAAERRLAAWLFVSHRYDPAEIAGDAHLLEQFELLSAQVRRWARKAGRADLREQIDTVEARVKAASASGGGEAHERDQ